MPERLCGEQLREEEPNITGLGALLIRTSAIVSFREVSRALAAHLVSQSVELRCGVEVADIREDPENVVVVTNKGDFQCRKLIACCELQSDRIARLAGLSLDHRIVPFRGEYFMLGPKKSGIVNRLIYPIPDPELPFLGIHLTRMINDSVTVGPNAVLGFSREDLVLMFETF